MTADSDTENADAELLRSFGPGGSARAWAPGRCTLVGDHVDYAGGRVACVALDLGVAVAVRPSADGLWRVSSRGRRVERADPAPAGDIGDRVFSAALALRSEGVPVPPLEVGVDASLPESAGLASSAALICAVIVAALRLAGARMGPRRLAATALRAERDFMGIRVGPLDHRAVIDAPARGVVILDCHTGNSTYAPWPWTDVVLAACHTGMAHDVGGAGYRSRTREVESALRAVSASDCHGLGIDAVERPGLSAQEARRLRHVITETARTDAVEAALAAGDAGALGAIMTASHASLRDDHEVSTPGLDAVVTSAVAVPGCYGARMVGAGFGGTAVALANQDSALACTAAMSIAAGPAAQRWLLRPAPGLAILASDAVCEP